MRFGWLIVLVAGCDSLLRLEQVTPPAWYPHATHRKAIELRPPDNGPLDDFVYPIAAAVDPELGAAARADGSDLFVTADDGLTVLPSEVERYEPAGRLALWVRIGHLD